MWEHPVEQGWHGRVLTVAVQGSVSIQHGARPHAIPVALTVNVAATSSQAQPGNVSVADGSLGTG